MLTLGFLFSLLSTVVIHTMTENVQENIALKGKTVQSSTFSNGAMNAIDECDLCCTNTKTEASPWWRLDLGKSQGIKEVSITNRIDCCPELIEGAEIRIGDSLENNGNNNPICAVISTLPVNKSISYPCGGTVGRYVNLVIPGDSKNLTLCEVKVYGTDGVKLTGNAIQSSVYEYWNAGRAIDGVRFAPGAASFCSHTLWEKNPWWRLELPEIYSISSVTITNRGDCCGDRLNGAEIHIGNSLENNGNNNPICAVIPSLPTAASQSFSCPQMEGQYVNVIVPGDKKLLTLCEVEVYGNLKVRKSVVRMKLISSSALAAPDNDNLLLQIESALALRGITDIQLSWTKLPQKEFRQDISRAHAQNGSCKWDRCFRLRRFSEWNGACTHRHCKSPCSKIQ